MPSTPNATPKAARRGRRPRKTSELSDLKQEGHNEEASGSETIEANGESQTESTPKFPEPSTPSRPSTKKAADTTKSQLDPIASVNRAKGKPQKQDVAGTQHKPQPHQTPAKTSKVAISTPERAIETPSRAYAGPMFHASPAASALPMPKFFSRSAPSNDKSVGLSKMVETGHTPTSNGSEGEGERRSAQDQAASASERVARESSPLDLLFQADRRDKAKMRSLTPEMAFASKALSNQQNLDGSPSRSAAESRHHSRHPTDNSIGGVFPLEIEGGAAMRSVQGPDHVHSDFSQSPAMSTRSKVKAQQQREHDHLQAQTLALKQMLFSPQAKSDTVPLDSGSSVPSVTPQTTPSKSSSRGYHSSPGDSPASLPGLASDANRHQRQASLLALAQRQIPAGAGGSTNITAQSTPRPASSHLRKEVILPHSPTTATNENNDPYNSPNTTHGPRAGPSPFHYQQQQKPSLQPSNAVPSPSLHETGTKSTPNLSGPIPKTTRASSARQNAQQQPAHNGIATIKDADNKDNTARSIEDDLRRILKLDVLGDQ